MPTTPPDHAGVLVPPPFFFVIPFCAGLLLHRLHPIPIPRREILVVPGLALEAVGVLLIAWAMGLFARARTSPIPILPTTAIVETGPYRFSRNPMYVGLTLLYIGLALWIGTPWPLLFLPVALIVVQRAVIAREERYLEAKFGEEYLARISHKGFRHWPFSG
jgi:protein-S-isoprenylcysteine O-methyltransferase Ste14